MSQSHPLPTRFDVDTWLVMRDDPVIPKAVIQRAHHKDSGDRYLVFRWDLGPAKRQLMSVVDSLEAADDLVLYAPHRPAGIYSGPPNGTR